MPSQNPALVYTRKLTTKTLPVVIRLECHPSVRHLDACPQSRERDASHSSCFFVLFFFLFSLCECCVSKCPSVWRPVMNITFRRSRGGNSDDEGALHHCILRSLKAASSPRAHTHPTSRRTLSMPLERTNLKALSGAFITTSGWRVETPDGRKWRSNGRTPGEEGRRELPEVTG